MLENIGFYTLTDERVIGSSPTSQMRRCEMIIIENCNFKCPYCKGLDDSVFGDRVRKQLSIEEIKTNIDHWCSGDAPLKNIRFSGGEPTLHKKLPEAVAYAREKGVERIAISSNGSAPMKVYQKLIESGCNDFSISLDADNAVLGDERAGGIVGAWQKVVNNVRELSKLTYVTVGVVLEKENVGRFIDTVIFASSLGVSDIRVIPSAQWNHPLPELKNIPQDVLSKHRILAYRVKNFIEGRHVRGLGGSDSKQCGLVLDDSVIAGGHHYPCVIYMREQGKPIGKVHNGMREDRVNWYKTTNVQNDPICKKNCLDVCIDYNNSFERCNRWKSEQ